MSWIAARAIELVRRALPLLVLLWVFGASQPASAGFQIHIVYDVGWTPSQRAIFESSKNFWQQQLGSYQAGIALTGPIIDATTFTEGVGGVLGSAGPTDVIEEAGFWLTSRGLMQFDTADLGFLESQGFLDEVIQHEMAHVLGFGTLWTANNLYVPDSGQYLGGAGLAAYRQEFVGQAQATFVPVELGGGGGTSNSHWDEVDAGAGLTGRVTSSGRDMTFELMTGWLNTNQSAFVSQTTLGQFRDLGFVAPIQAVPEPSALVLMGLGVFAGSVRRWSSKSTR